jgi:hypothetical protein
VSYEFDLIAVRIEELFFQFFGEIFFFFFNVGLVVDHLFAECTQEDSLVVFENGFSAFEVVFDESVLFSEPVQPLRYYFDQELDLFPQIFVLLVILILGSVSFLLHFFKLLCL